MNTYLEMNALRDFLFTLFGLGVLVALPFILVPDLLEAINRLGIGIFVTGLLFCLVVILALPAGRGKT